MLLEPFCKRGDPSYERIEEYAWRAADLGPADHVQKFFKKNKVYGPVFRSTVKVYGRDITYPLPAHLLTTITKLAALIKEDYGGAPVLKAGYFVPQPAPVKTSSYGAQYTLRNLVDPAYYV